MTLPVALFGHGSPLNTLANNRFSAAWRAYAATLPPPRAVLAISAHWYVPRTRVSAAPRPPTIHDFNANFPPALFDFGYPACGDPELAGCVADLLRPIRVERDEASWGFDHGAYCILAHLFPQAQIPMVELYRSVQTAGVSLRPGVAACSAARCRRVHHGQRQRRSRSGALRRRSPGASRTIGRAVSTRRCGGCWPRATTIPW